MKKRKGAIQYTKGHIRDINGCMRIIKEFPDYFTKKSYKEIRRCLRQNLFIVAKDNDSIIGFCCIKGKKTLVREISQLAVDKGYQHKKIGTKLVAHVCNFLKKTGMRYVLVKTLDKTLHNDYYKETRKFYEHIGFIKIISIDPYPSWDPGNPCALYIKNI